MHEFRQTARHGKIFRAHAMIFAQWAASSMVEQLTLNQRVGGSSPPRLTNHSG
jgi:hypothetical protein